MDSAVRHTDKRWKTLRVLVCCLWLTGGAPEFCGVFGSAPAVADTQVRSGPFDLEGRQVDPFRQAQSSKALVFIFLANECPICNRFAPEIRRLHEEFKGRGVSFWLVHADASETADSVRTHAKEYKLEMPVLRDPNHVLVRKAEVRITPEAAVFLPGGQLAYRGRINDKYVDFGKERASVTQHDLREALLAVLEGKSPPNSRTRAIGCYIPDTK